MQSAVDICNLALSHLGDTATVASLDPPEGSSQAQHCATFYPMARDSLLEMHDWGFATTRIKPALLHGNWLGWEFAYTRPSEIIRIVSVKPVDSCRDESIPSVPYLTEIDENGNSIILCDHENIVVRYTRLVTDTNRFSPLFSLSLSWYLASMLAGPIIKGATGATEAKRCASVAQVYITQAAASDTNQNETKQNHRVAWMEGR